MDHPPCLFAMLIGFYSAALSCLCHLYDQADTVDDILGVEQADGGDHGCGARMVGGDSQLRGGADRAVEKRVARDRGALRQLFSTLEQQLKIHNNRLTDADRDRCEILQHFDQLAVYQAKSPLSCCFPRFPYPLSY